MRAQGAGWFTDICADLDLLDHVAVQHGLNFRDLQRYCKGFLLHCSKLDTITQKSPACHNCVMHAYYADHFVLPLPDGHRFPMAKYRMLRDRIAQQLPGVVGPYDPHRINCLVVAQTKMGHGRNTGLIASIGVYLAILL